MSSVLIQNLDNCDNLVYQVGENQKNLKKNNVDQLLGYTPNTHLYRILEFNLKTITCECEFFNNKY